VIAAGKGKEGGGKGGRGADSIGRMAFSSFCPVDDLERRHGVKLHTCDVSIGDIQEIRAAVLEEAWLKSSPK
jgi:hypothetical protein